MNASSIHKFFELYSAYLKTRDNVLSLMYDLENMKANVNRALKTTVDNGLSSDFLCDMYNQYEAHKFNSSAVKQFIDSIDKLCFSEVCPELKDRIQATQIHMRIDRHHNENIIDKDGIYEFEYVSKVVSPVYITFKDTKSDKMFMLSVPIKDAMNFNVLDWSHEFHGMYIVEVWSDENAITAFHKTICRVFNANLVSHAVNMYLSGGFDKDLADMQLWSSFEYLDNNDQWKALAADLLFSSSSCNHSSLVEVKNCIDDCKEYDIDIQRCNDDE